MRARGKLSLWLIATLVVVTLAWMRPTAAPAQEDMPVPAKTSDGALERAVEEVMTKLAKNQKGLFPGIAQKNVAGATRGAARVVGDIWLPLAGSPYAPRGKWQGVVSAYDNEDSPVVDTVTVVLLVDEHDGESLRDHVFAVGKELGFDLEPDDEEPQLIWGSHPGGREFWISLGTGVLAIECTVPAS